MPESTSLSVKINKDFKGMIINNSKYISIVDGSERSSSVELF